MSREYAMIDTLKRQLTGVLAGKDEVINQLLITLISGGHLLIEDVPGVGKTTLAHALAVSIDSSFGRIQFTADMLPADIIGVEVFDTVERQFVFHPGMIFHQMILADEINRATPKAQSALLEAMAEGQVSIESETRLLPHPFFVMATQNPSEHIGTFPLPESQLDRFFMRINIGYPDKKAEKEILLGSVGQVKLTSLTAVASWQEILAVRSQLAAMTVSDQLLDYLLELLALSRNGEWLQAGISPRAGRDLLQAAKAHAWLARQTYVSAADVQAVWLPCLAHRVGGVGDMKEALLALCDAVAVPG
ncbi:MAG: AAA family ATPase [Mariprofundus sp.]|nr:AAA family ATPase [Mariprofundus sp.]